MTAKSQRPKGRGGVLSSLNGAIQAVDLAKEDSKIAQAKTAFDSVSVLLAIIRVGFLLGLIDQPLANAAYRTRRSTKRIALASD